MWALRTRSLRAPVLGVRLSASGLFVVGISLPLTAFSIEFNDSFLSKQGAAVELKFFEQGSTIAPGFHSVDVYLNHALLKRETIEFKARDNHGDVQPVISLGLLKAMGVNIGRLQQEKLIEPQLPDDAPVDVSSLVLGAGVEFDVTALALQIAVPQAYIQRNARGRVDPSLWDNGITAFYTNYQTNFSSNINQGRRSDYRYIGLRSGLNIGAWRLRNDSSISGSTGVRDTFNSNRTFVERDVAALKGKFAGGDLYTQGEIFDSVRFRGAQLTSELGMLSNDELGFAPVVRGIAETNATVEIRQNDYIIYSTSVPAGAFEITDIYPSGSNGDLSIKIIEADGREREYSQAYSYLPVMTRRGNARYSLAAGQYESQSTTAPKFVQGTLVYGLSDNLTTYGGVLAAKTYRALNLGVGVNSQWGGLSFDVTNSTSEDAVGRKASGQSARFLYSKTLSQTDTTFTMVGYRYSTESYRTFSQHVEDLDHMGPRTYGRQKSRFDVNVNQSLAGRGSLFFSVGETSYWNRQFSTRRWQLGYSGNYADVSYSFALAHTAGQGNNQSPDNQMTASISMPFGDVRRSQRLYSSVTSSSQGDTDIQTGLAGNLDEQATLSYSVQGSHNKRSGGAGSMGLSWDAPTAKVSGNYGQGRDTKHVDLGATGSVVVHKDGVTFGQPVGETFALIDVGGTQGVGVDSSVSVRTDSNGYAVVPYVQPYRSNWVNLDTNTLDIDTEITESSKVVVPTRGAIVKTQFVAATGRRVQFVLTQEDGQSIPFGAQAYDENDQILGVVDNASRVLVFGEHEHGELTIKWGDKQSCRTRYVLSTETKRTAYEVLKAVCKVG